MMRAIRNFISLCNPGSRARNAASGRFVRTSDSEKMVMIRRAAERANDEQADIMRRAARMSSKSAK